MGRWVMPILLDSGSFAGSSCRQSIFRGIVCMVAKSIKRWSFPFIAVAAVAFAFFATAPSADAKVRVKVKTVYYDIHGKTGFELTKSMIKRGPKAAGLEHAIASTKPDIDFGKPKAVQNSRYCKVQDVDIVVNITYTYPRWRNQKGASPQLRRAWKKLYGELVKHEETHGKILIETANRIYREILRERGTVARECKDFGNRIIRKMPHIMASYENRQRAFDRRESLGISRVNRLQKTLLYQK